MAIYAIGDIQGCYQELQQLLAKIGFSASRDQLWIAGDLVNRGPQSLQVLDYLYQLDGAARVVLGNHDLHLLAINSGARLANKKDTLNAIFESPRRHQLLHWLQQQALIITDHERAISMVHAGVPPIWSLAEAHAYAREVETVLQGENASEFFTHMYGNEPDTWRDQLETIDRHRLITNYFTRMRFCTADGQLDLRDKDNRESSRPGFAPWYRYDNPSIAASHQFIFGHWAALQGRSDSAKHHALDTGCVWRGSLTAMDIDTYERTSVASINHI